MKQDMQEDIWYSSLIHMILYRNVVEVNHNLTVLVSVNPADDLQLPERYRHRHGITPLPPTPVV